MPQPQFSVEEAAGLQQHPYLPITLHGATSQKTVFVMIAAVRAHGCIPPHQINEESVGETPKVQEV